MLKKRVKPNKLIESKDNYDEGYIKIYEKKIENVANVTIISVHDFGYDMDGTQREIKGNRIFEISYD